MEKEIENILTFLKTATDLNCRIEQRWSDAHNSFQLGIVIHTIIPMREWVNVEREELSNKLYDSTIKKLKAMSKTLLSDYEAMSKHL